MLHFLLVVLYFVSIIMIVGGIWAIISSILSKDPSMGMGAVIGVVIILLGAVLFLISDAPEWDDKTSLSKKHSDKNAPPVPLVKQIK